MSLLCTETQTYIMFGSPLYVGLLKEGRYSCAISQEALDRIPESEQRPEPCATATDGLDIYRAKSNGPTSRGAYEWTSMRRTEFLFSVSAETAKRYVPTLWQECQPDCPVRPTVVNITLVTTPARGETIH